MPGPFNDAKFSDATQQEPVKVNPVVDPQAALTDVADTEFQPQSSQELEFAVKNLVQGTRLSPQDAYQSIKQALQKGEEEMSHLELENVIRKQVRAILAEASKLPSPRFMAPSMLKYYSDILGKPLDKDYVFTPEDEEKVAVHLRGTENAFKKSKEQATGPVVVPPDVKPRVIAPSDVAAKGKGSKNVGALRDVLSTMDLDKEQENLAASVRTESVIKEIMEEVSESALNGIVNFFQREFKKIVDKHNKGVTDPEMKFNFVVDEHEGSSDELLTIQMEDLFEAYLELGIEAKEMGLFDKIAQDLAKFKAGVRDVKNVLEDVSVDGKSWQAWAAEQFKNLKQNPALVRQQGGSKVNVTYEKMSAPFVQYLTNVGYSDEEAADMVTAMKGPKTGAATTNMAKKLFQVPVIDAWEELLFNTGNEIFKPMTGAEASGKDPLYAALQGGVGSKAPEAFKSQLAGVRKSWGEEGPAEE